MSSPPAFPQPSIGGDALLTPQNVVQPNEERPLTTVSDGSNTAQGSEQDAELTFPQSPADSNGSTRPLAVRNKSSNIIFTDAGAGAKDRDTQTFTEPVAEGGQPPADDGVAQAPRPRPLPSKRSTFDTRSMFSTTSAMTVAEAQTKYVNMLLALDHIHTINDMLAFAFCWLLLAGFVVLPGTLRKTIPEFVEEKIEDEQLRKAINLVIEHVPL